MGVIMNNDDFLSPNEFIEGTDIPRPRNMKPNETSEEYLNFLRNFYSRYSFKKQEKNYDFSNLSDEKLESRIQELYNFIAQQENGLEENKDLSDEYHALVEEEKKRKTAKESSNIPSAEDYHMNKEAYDDYVAEGYVPGTEDFERAAKLDGQPFTPIVTAKASANTESKPTQEKNEEKTPSKESENEHSTEKDSELNNKIFTKEKFKEAISICSSDEGVYFVNQSAAKRFNITSNPVNFGELKIKLFPITKEQIQQIYNESLKDYSDFYLNSISLDEMVKKTKTEQDLRNYAESLSAQELADIISSLDKNANSNNMTAEENGLTNYERYKILKDIYDEKAKVESKNEQQNSASENKDTPKEETAKQIDNKEEKQTATRENKKVVTIYSDKNNNCYVLEDVAKMFNITNEPVILDNVKTKLFKLTEKQIQNIINDSQKEGANFTLEGKAIESLFESKKTNNDTNQSEKKNEEPSSKENKPKKNNASNKKEYSSKEALDFLNQALPKDKKRANKVVKSKKAKKSNLGKAIVGLFKKIFSKVDKAIHKRERIDEKLVDEISNRYDIIFDVDATKEEIDAKYNQLKNYVYTKLKENNLEPDILVYESKNKYYLENIEKHEDITDIFNKIVDDYDKVLSASEDEEIKENEETRGRAR